jgi:hypothetical protein
MLAITQTQYYLALLKYLTLIGGTAIFAILFMALVWAIVYYSHYWR